MNKYSDADHRQVRNSSKKGGNKQISFLIRILLPPRDVFVKDFLISAFNNKNVIESNRYCSENGQCIERGYTV